MVADNGGGEVIQTNNTIEDGMGNQGNYEWVDVGDEMCVLGEVANNDGNDMLSVDLMEALHKV